MLFEWSNIFSAGYDAKTHQEWPVYPHGEALDRTQYVTASEVSKCARRVKFDKLAMAAGDYDPELGTKNPSSIDWGFFERGHTIEAWAVELITAGWHVAHEGGYDLLFTGKEQYSFVDGFQSGTPDGVFLSRNGAAPRIGILEIKSIDPRTNKNRLPKPEHVDQVMQNLDLVSRAFDAVPIGGDILYIDASNYKDIRPFHVHWDEAKADELADRAEWIMKTDRPEDLPDEGMYKSGVCKTCPHKGPCGDIIRSMTNENGVELKAVAMYRCCKTGDNKFTSIQKTFPKKSFADVDKRLVISTIFSMIKDVKAVVACSYMVVNCNIKLRGEFKKGNISNCDQRKLNIMLKKLYA